MKKYIINYNTGVTETVEAYDLNEAKEAAREGMNYTQQNVTIETLDGEVITTSQWIGVEASEEEIESGLVLETIGNSGFYQLWSDELENL